MPLHVIFSRFLHLLQQLIVSNFDWSRPELLSLCCTGLLITPPWDGTLNFLIQSQTLYYHDTPPPWIHKALKTSHNSTSQKVSVSAWQGLDLISDRKSNVLVSPRTENQMSRSCTLRSRLHPWHLHLKWYLRCYKCYLCCLLRCLVVAVLLDFVQTIINLNTAFLALSHLQGWKPQNALHTPLVQLVI